MDKNTAWTTRGYIETRSGSSAKTGTHIRKRDYWVDSVHTVAIALADAAKSKKTTKNAETDLSLEMLKSSLCKPERPLFVGRKCCLPSAPIYVKTQNAPSPLAALCQEPRIPTARSSTTKMDGLPAWWMENERGDWVPKNNRQILVVDEKDWLNQLHGGSRLMRHGLIYPPSPDRDEKKPVKPTAGPNTKVNAKETPNG